MIGTFILIIVGKLVSFEVSLLTGRQDPHPLDSKLCYLFFSALDWNEANNYYVVGNSNF